MKMEISNRDGEKQFVQTNNLVNDKIKELAFQEPQVILEEPSQNGILYKLTLWNASVKVLEKADLMTDDTSPNLENKSNVNSKVTKFKAKEEHIVGSLSNRKDSKNKLLSKKSQVKVICTSEKVFTVGVDQILVSKPNVALGTQTKSTRLESPPPAQIRNKNKEDKSGVNVAKVPEETPRVKAASKVDGAHSLKTKASSVIPPQTSLPSKAIRSRNLQDKSVLPNDGLELNIKTENGTDRTTPALLFEDPDVPQFVKKSTCKYCSYSNSNLNSLKRHMRKHAGDKPFKCKNCPANFAEKSHLILHNQSHSVERPFQCKYCPYRCVDSSILVRHHRSHTGEKPYKCSKCPASFSRGKILSRHFKIHTVDKPYKCTICSASFELKEYLVHQYRKHSGDKFLKCGCCSATFSKKSDIVNHLQSHLPPHQQMLIKKAAAPKKKVYAPKKVVTKDIIYRCDYCSRSFAWRSNFVRHLRIHTGEKPYKCSICLMEFARKNTLDVHILNHTGEKPYQCEHCSAKFNRKNQLEVHNRKHTGEKPFHCDSCSYSSADKSTLSRHRLVHTGARPFKCDCCSAKFARRSQLVVHNRKHTGEKPFKCDYCSYRASAKGLLTRHLSLKHLEEQQNIKIEPDQPDSLDICHD